MITPQPPTYPARPLNGGALDVALPKRGEWRAECKYNGWRALVHVPSGAMFNRELKELSISDEFKVALSKLKAIAPAAWVDCEALERRHKIGRGTLIVLDLVVPRLTYLQRRERLLSLLPAPMEPSMYPEDALYVVPSRDDASYLWHKLQAINAYAGCDFYEGIVCKRIDAFYPMQTISPSRESACWVKHRFIR
jgi:ATP-dependent DNA ligase